MPWGDWQFWVVTVAAVGGVFALARAVVPRRPRRVRTTLTIGGQEHSAARPRRRARRSPRS